jgi:hypothetical protein
MQRTEAVECPFCLDLMKIEERGGVVWLVCPNGCATEIEAAERKPAVPENGGSLQARAAGR